MGVHFKTWTKLSFRCQSNTATPNTCYSNIQLKLFTAVSDGPRHPPPDSTSRLASSPEQSELFSSKLTTLSVQIPLKLNTNTMKWSVKRPPSTSRGCFRRRKRRQRKCIFGGCSGTLWLEIKDRLSWGRGSRLWHTDEMKVSRSCRWALACQQNSDCQVQCSTSLSARFLSTLPWSYLDMHHLCQQLAWIWSGVWGAAEWVACIHVLAPSLHPVSP